MFFFYIYTELTRLHNPLKNSQPKTNQVNPLTNPKKDKKIINEDKISTMLNKSFQVSKDLIINKTKKKIKSHSKISNFKNKNKNTPVNISIAPNIFNIVNGIKIKFKNLSCQLATHGEIIYKQTTFLKINENKLPTKIISRNHPR